MVSKTGQTKDISDLTGLMEEVKDPASILPHKVKSIAKQQKSESKNLLGTENLVKYIKVEQTENKEINEKAGVSCYPSFYLYKNGEKVDTLEGADDEGLKLKIKKLINPEYVEIHYAEFVETKEDFDKLIKEKEVVFVDFTASWCPPCKMIKPVFEEWAEKFKDNDKVKFVKIDVDENDAVAQEYAIRSMPTLKVFKSGKEEENAGFGGASVDKLKTMVETYTKDL